MTPIDAHPDGSVTIRVRVQPGASREEMVGPLGDRLKVRVAAPPEAGRANDAVRALLARSLGVREGDVALVSGRSSRDKVFRAAGVSAARAASALLGSAGAG